MKKNTKKYKKNKNDNIHKNKGQDIKCMDLIDQF